MWSFVLASLLDNVFEVHSCGNVYQPSVLCIVRWCGHTTFCLSMDNSKGWNSMSGKVGCLRVCAVRNNATMNIHCKSLCGKKHFPFIIRKREKQQKDQHRFSSYFWNASSQQNGALQVGPRF